MPRMVYRRLAQNLSSGRGNRQAFLDQAVQELCISEYPDMRKLKFTMPDFLRNVVSEGRAKLFARENRTQASVGCKAVAEFGINDAFL